MAGNVHNHSGGVTGWFKSVANTISGAFKKGGFLHFKSITKTEPKSAWRIPAGDRENAPTSKSIRNRKTTHARQDQVQSVRTPDSKKKAVASPPKEPSSFQAIRNKQQALVHNIQSERHEAAAAFKKACDNKGVNYKQALTQGLFPELKAAWDSAKKRAQIAQIGLDQIDRMAGKSADRK